jgi:hypothetical protein
MRISYRIEQDAGPMLPSQWREAVTRACATWNATGIVHLLPAAQGAAADVTLGWRRGHHGACEPFAMASTVAHSGPVRSGTFVHFDAGRQWLLDAENDRDGYSLYGTALHELGHVLGLGHSIAADAVMRTGVIRSTPLAISDLHGLRSIYGGGVAEMGDLCIEALGDDRRLVVLHGVAPFGLAQHAVLDADGDGHDDVLVWRCDPAGLGQLMIYHFDASCMLARTTGPFLGAMAAGSNNVFFRSANGERLLVTVFQNGRRVLRRFDEHGSLAASSLDRVASQELDAALQRGNAMAGDLAGDGRRQRVRQLRDQ